MDSSEEKKEEAKKKPTSEEVKAQIENDLRTNPKYKSFFDNYHADSIESFIKHYGYKKAFWLEHGENFADLEERSLLHYSEKAFERLWDIQQKKLFNLQCQWRAGAITLPGIECTYDFYYWEHKIRECPFLTPVSNEEYELYRDYILTPDFESSPLKIDWQNYDEIKEEYQNNDGISVTPEWYMFYDSRMGNIMGQLPDVKGEKEEVRSKA